MMIEAVNLWSLVDEWRERADRLQDADETALSEAWGSASDQLHGALESWLDRLERQPKSSDGYRAGYRDGIRDICKMPGTE